VHLVVPHARLPIARTVIMPAADRRSVFAVPRGELVYLGTTDTFYERADPWPTIEAADVDYLLAAAAQRFSTPPLTHADVVAAWAGVRPLVAQAGKSASDISRKDEVWTGPAGVLAIAGRQADRLPQDGRTHRRHGRGGASAANRPGARPTSSR
jgi:glycerol-3-phosphate dehydrogenase